MSYMHCYACFTDNFVFTGIPYDVSSYIHNTKSLFIQFTHLSIELTSLFNALFALLSSLFIHSGLVEFSDLTKLLKQEAPIYLT